MRYLAPIVLSLFVTVVTAEAYMPRPCHDPPPYAQTDPLIGVDGTSATDDELGQGVAVSYECSLSQHGEAWTAEGEASIQDADSDAASPALPVLAAVAGSGGVPLRAAGRRSRLDDDLVHFALNFRYFPEPFRDRHCPEPEPRKPGGNRNDAEDAGGDGAEIVGEGGGETRCVPYDASTQLYVSTGVLYTVEPFQDLGLSAGVGVRVDFAQFETLRSLDRVLLDVEASYRVYDVGDFDVDSVVLSFGFKFKIGKRDRK